MMKRVLLTALLTTLIGSLLASCSNTTSLSVLNRNSASAPAEDLEGEGVEKISYRITNVNVGATSGTGTQAISQVFFSAASDAKPISESCNLATDTTSSSTVSAKPCACQFSWQEVNQLSGTVIPITRTVHTAVSKVQSTFVECATPSVYATEIPDNTVVRVTIKPIGSNPEQFTAANFNFTKNGSNTPQGSFQDAEGRAFDNIFRYACYEQFKRGLQLRSKVQPMQHPQNGDTAYFVMASQFCFADGSGATDGGPGCTGVTLGNSAQSYYYNLYIRNTDKGGININNQRYRCPLVTPSLTGGNSADFWPLDSSFALALSPSPDFPVGVEALSKVGISGDPSTVNSSCYGGASSPGNDNSLVKSCIGFAAKPSADGACPVMKNAQGKNVPTFRLRRYNAVYPPLYNTDGKMISEPYPIDTVYALDRRVDYPLADPLKPYTMRGPKPCPFAYYDRAGVVAGNEYVATNDPRWAANPVNVDGIKFPDIDQKGSGAEPDSCSTAMPLLNSTGTRWSVGTVSSSNPTASLQSMPVRPVDPWTPTYIEDKEFLACAPESSPAIHPPLHFGATAQGEATYCAEVYPNTNPDRPNPDAYAFPPASTAHGGAANEHRVADPTAVWKGYPLLAPEADVANALSASSSYACTVTFDNGQGKQDKMTPSQGCCSIGGAPALGHLENGSCGSPSY